MSQDPDSAAVKSLAREGGFDLVGITTAEPPPEAAFFAEWLERGYAGEMGYLYGRRGQLRRDARNLLPSARSVICLGLLYNTPHPPGPVSRYAWGDDYHDLLHGRIEQLAVRLQALAPCECKICVDTAPLLERTFAQRAGLGWIGHNTCLINQQIGSWVFLGEILTSLELEADEPAPFRCGSCRRCIEACPTQALVPAGGTPGPAFTLDSRRCISYWTIELRGPVPEEHRGDNQGLVFGCDICQQVCPWNRRAPVTAEPAFAPRSSQPLTLDRLASLTAEEFEETFRSSPLRRTRYSGLLRNVALAMGASGDARHRPALQKLAASEDALIRDHARFALESLCSASPPGEKSNTSTETQPE